MQTDRGPVGLCTLHRGVLGTRGGITLDDGSCIATMPGGYRWVPRRQGRNGGAGMTTGTDTGIIPFPFPLPPGFTRELGYDAYQTPAWIVEAFRAAGAEPAAFAPKRFVGVFWEPAGDEVTWDDGATTFCGANWSAYLALVQPRTVGAFLFERGLDLGTSDTAATHWLVVDRERGTASVAPVAIARRIVQDQWLDEVPA